MDPRLLRVTREAGRVAELTALETIGRCCREAFDDHRAMCDEVDRLNEEAEGAFLAGDLTGALDLTRRGVLADAERQARWKDYRDAHALLVEVLQAFALADRGERALPTAS